MADFTFLSDTDESAVEEILSESADYVALKQISSLKLSDSVLPDHLDARFRRLKTFPSSQPSHIESGKKPAVNSDDLDPKLTELDSHDSVYSKSKPHLSLSPSSSSDSSNSWLEVKSYPQWKTEIEEFGSGKRSGSVSPPMSGCLCCSPKKVSRKKSFRGGEGGRRLNDDVLEKMAVGSLSRKNQEKITKIAVEEEMKIARESQKIVEWALHASARMEPRVVHLDDHVTSDK